MIDFKELAKAFRDGDLEWHEKEWKEFIKGVEDRLLKSLEGEIGELKTNYHNIRHPDAPYQQLVDAKNQTISDILTIIKKYGEGI